ncbi:hypothetical protein M413DRAFT_14031 [Hebeloma cylindrosporum]|uniref:F-box domain-containing protein n=1 Tax=Hebeloma cylindrosporum TaxID=76867 RepID=A0A0C3BW97_HEBCY|nr:hypothetical protein M413DRAFT_14031 [Hebeloma cylindrosporum h7]
MSIPSEYSELLHPDGPTKHPDQEMALPLFEIDSFLPIIKKLVSNAFFLENKSIHIRGKVSKADLDALYCYTREVGTFILTDSSPDLEGWTISPATYVRLAQLHKLDTPFFPSLKHLRIVHANSSLNHLNLLVSYSLQSIELYNIDHTQEEVFLSFLITLSDECPELASIKLTSPLSTAVVEGCLKFNHLRVLELHNVLIQLDFNLLSTIGQAFPQLEHFVLGARTAKYTRAAVPRPEGRDKPMDSGSSDSEASVPRDGQDHPGFEPASQSEKMESSLRPEPPFLRLEKLHITGSLDLIQDLVEAIPSPGLKEIGLTLVRSNPSNPSRKPFPSKPRTDLETPIFVTCLGKVLSAWRHCLANVFIGQHFPTYTPIFPTLPVAVCEEILLLPELERLDVSFWTIEKFLRDSIPPTLTDPALSKLKYLHLPVYSDNKGTSLSGLRLIAESFPNLVSFKARVVSLDDSHIPVLDPSKPAKHVL